MLPSAATSMCDKFTANKPSTETYIWMRYTFLHLLHIHSLIHSHTYHTYTGHQNFIGAEHANDTLSTYTYNAHNKWRHFWCACRIANGYCYVSNTRIVWPSNQKSHLDFAIFVASSLLAAKIAIYTYCLDYDRTPTHIIIFPCKNVYWMMSDDKITNKRRMYSTCARISQSFAIASFYCFSFLFGLQYLVWFRKKQNKLRKNCI